MTRTSNEKNIRRGLRSTLSPILWALAIFGILLLVRVLDAQIYLRAGLERMRDLGAWGAILFAFLYAVAAVLMARGTLDSTRVTVTDPAPVKRKKAGPSRGPSGMSMDAH